MAVFSYRRDFAVLGTPVFLPCGVVEERWRLVLSVDYEGFHAEAEVSPLPSFSPESFDEVENAAPPLLAELAELCQKEAGLEEVLAVLSARCAHLPSLAHGASFLVAELVARRLGRRVESVIGTLARETVPVSDLLVLSPKDELALGAVVDRFLQQRKGRGITSVKIKISSKTVDIVNQFLRLFRAKAPGWEVRLDGNQQFDLNEALLVARTLSPHGVSYFEEPLTEPTCAAFELFADVSPIPLALDESLLRDEILNSKLVSTDSPLGALVVKPMLLGGWPVVSELRQRAPRVPIVISSIYEGCLGTRMNFVIARATPAPILPCGLLAFAQFAGEDPPEVSDGALCDL